LFQTDGSKLIYRYDAEELWIEPWGANSLRVRASKLDEIYCRNHADMIYRGFKGFERGA